MGEEQGLPGGVQVSTEVQVGPAVDMNVPIAEIEKQIVGKLQGEPEQTKTDGASAVPTPEPEIETQQAPVEQQVMSQPETVIVETKPVEEKTVEQKTLEQVMKQKHLKSPEELAKIYIDLEKEFHKRAQVASMQKQEQVLTQPFAEQLSPEEAFRRDFDRDPIGTIAQVSAILNRPLKEQQDNLQLEKVIIRLSNSPDTMDFNMPEIQEEIKTILDSKPYLRADLTSNLEDVYHIAESRVRKRNKSTGTATGQTVISINKSAAVVETGSMPKRIVSEPLNVWSSPIDKIEQEYNRLKESLR